MCGITGIRYFDRREPTYDLLENMTSVIHHRGPDDTGFFIEEGIGLGFKRLSIIDLQEGHQPLANEDGAIWVVFNGEIYNYKQLRHQLVDKGHIFKTETDTEVLVHLYEEYGIHCVRHLRGMFSFAVWDKKKQELYCARDFFGIKPFYYYADNHQFIFGSEIKSILAIEGMQRAVRPESLLNYLTFQYVPDPHTMFSGIQKLPPAHFLHITQNGRMKIQKYWDPMFEPEDRPIQEYIEELRVKLEDSVKHHMQSDVERGCFLSSGIDSTSIAAHMKEIESVKTFSVGFEGIHNECLISKETAKQLGTNHYEHMITPTEYFDALPKAIWHQDEPVADPSAIALYMVAKLAKEHVTVVLSGEGADEIFGGYRMYREPLSLKAFDSIPLGMRRFLHHLVKKLPAGLKGRNTLLRGTTPLQERFFGNAMLFAEDIKSELMSFPLEGMTHYEDAIQLAESFYHKVKHLDPSTQMQYIDLNLWMPGDILAKADKMTMAHSLELRVPFLDKEVFELARKIPTKYRLANGTTKYILRQAMEGIVPESILHRPKLGFPVPLRDWLKQPQYANRIVEEMNLSSLKGYINETYVQQLVRNHQDGRGDYARKIWAIYIFSLWHQTFVAGQTEYSKRKNGQREGLVKVAL